VFAVPAECDGVLGVLQLAIKLEKHVERVHPGHKEQYDKLVAAGRKRKADNTAGTTAKKLKQPLIADAVRSANTVTQQHVNEAIVNFVVGALVPLCVVEVQEFKISLQHYNPICTP